MQKCECCGKAFLPGNNEYGIPNGVGYVNNAGYETIICSDCIMNRTDRAMKVVQLNECKTWEDNQIC